MCANCLPSVALNTNRTSLQSAVQDFHDYLSYINFDLIFFLFFSDEGPTLET